MIASLRRISLSLLLVGIFMLSGFVMSSLVRNCTSGSESCVAASIIFGIPEYSNEVSNTISFTTGASTPVQSEDNFFSVIAFILMLKAVSVYLIFIGVIMLLVLEVAELHYIRMFLSKKNMRSA